MSNFEPFSAGDHHAWQSAQDHDDSRNFGSGNEPRQPTEAERLDRLSDVWEQCGALVTQLMATQPDRCVDIVAHATWKKGIFGGYGAGFVTVGRMWPIGTIQVVTESVNKIEAGMTLEGTVYRHGHAVADTMLTPKMQVTQPVCVRREAIAGHRVAGSLLAELRRQAGVTRLGD